MIKKIIAAAFIAGISTTATAQTTAPMATGSVMSDDMVTVVQISQANKASDSNTTQVPDIYRNPTNEVMTQAQAEISSDAALKAVLERKNVQLQNVVGVQTAANGGKVVYVK